MKKINVFLSFFVGSLISSAIFASEKPNVIVIVADDMAISDIGAFGSEIKTPNIDSLALKGVRLSNFYAAPNCSPTRAMLLTGVDNHLAGMGNMGEFMQTEQKGKPGYENRLNERVANLAEVLGVNGYRTLMTGKWHLGRSEEHSPKGKGFDKSFVLIQGGASHFDDMKGVWARDPKALYREDGKQVDVPSGFYSSEFYTDRMIQYIESTKDTGKPFFSYLSYTAPHWPLQAPDKWIKKYKGKYSKGYEDIRNKRLANMKKIGLFPNHITPNLPMADQLPDWEKLTPEQRAREARTMEVYAAMVENMDHHIGELIKYLKKTGQYDNTLIIFMADNGAAGNSPANLGDNSKWIDQNFDNKLENMGRKGSFIDLGAQWAQVTSTPYSMYKGFTTQGGINVPAIVSYPGMPNQGKIIKDATHVMDIMPTILDFVGVQSPGKIFNGREVHAIQGSTILPAIKGQNTNSRVLGWELFDRRAILKDEWKLALNEKPYGTGNWQLFNLKEDPNEMKDLAKANPEKLQELILEWEKYVAQNGVVVVTPKERAGKDTCLYGYCVK